MGISGRHGSQMMAKLLLGGDWNHGILWMSGFRKGNFRIPSDEGSPSFFTGVGQPPTRYIYIYLYISHPFIHLPREWLIIYIYIPMMDDFHDPSLIHVCQLWKSLVEGSKLLTQDRSWSCHSSSQMLGSGISVKPLYIIILPYFTGNICHDHYIYQILIVSGSICRRTTYASILCCRDFQRKFRRSTWIVEPNGDFPVPFQFYLLVCL